MNKCEYIYPCDKSISDEYGSPCELQPEYFVNFSILKKVDNIFLGEEFVNICQRWYSSNLYAATEPILFNYYLNRDIYRFLWIRSFHKPIIFSLNMENDRIWLDVKMLENHLRDIDSEWYVKTELHKVIELDHEKWHLFEKRLRFCNFWNMNVSKDESGHDGAEWILEGHLKNNYKYVIRWSPSKDSPFAKCCQYLIELSGLHEEIY